MAELASRIGKRAPDPPLYGHRTWKRPGLEEEERQKAMPQTISFGNGHSLSSTSKWDGDAMDYDSDASSVNNPMESVMVASPITTRRPTSTSTTTSRSPKIIRNRIKDSGTDGDSSLSLMERLGVGALVETARSPSATPIECGAREGVVDGNNASTSKPTDHKAPSLPATTSADMATEDLLIPGLTIAQPQVGSPANVNGRDAQEATASTGVTSHSPELINNMRRLLVPLIVKKAEQSLSSADTRSTKTPDLAQRADAVVTTEVCDEFIRQAIASVKGLKDVGKTPNSDHLPIQHKNIALATATRSPTPLPPGLGSISTLPIAASSHPTHPGKTMLPDHPTPPSLPRAMRLNVQPNRFPPPGKDEPPKSPTWKGKEKEIFPTSTRAKSPWRRPRSQSPGPRSASTHRRSPLPTNTGSNFDRRPSPPRGRDPYRQTDDWRSQPPSWKETTNHHLVDPHTRSPPPSSAKDDHGWRGYRHPPSPEAPPFRFPNYKDRERTRTRSPSLPPGPTVDRLPNNKRKAYSPVRRDGPLRGWSRSPPRREAPPGPFLKKKKYNASPAPHAQAWSPEAPPLQEPYGSPPQKRRTSGSGPFNGVGGYDDRKQRSSFSYSRRERSPLERGASWRDGSPLGYQPPPPSSAASSTYSSSRRDMNSPQPQAPPPWTAPVGGSSPFEPSRQWKEQQQQQQQNRFPRSPPAAHPAKPPPAPPLPPPRSAGYDASSPLATLAIPKALQAQPVSSLPARPQSVEEHTEMMMPNGTLASSVYNNDHAYFDPEKGMRGTSLEPKAEALPITVDWDAVGHDGQSYENPIELDYGISSSRGTTVPVMPVGRAMSVDEDHHHRRGDDAMEVDTTTNTAIGNMECNPPGLSVATSDDNDNDNDNSGQPSLLSSGTVAATAAAATTTTKTRRKRGRGGKVVQENTPKVRPLFEQHMEEEVDRKPDIPELEKSLPMVSSTSKPVPDGESSSSGSSLFSPSQVVPPPPPPSLLTAPASLEPSLHRRPITPADATVEKELSSPASSCVSTPAHVPAERAMEVATSAANAEVGRAEDMRDLDEEMLVQPEKQAMTLEEGHAEEDAGSNASIQQEDDNDQGVAVTLQAQYDEQAQERVPDPQPEPVGASNLQAIETDGVMQQAKEQSLEKEARQAEIDIGNAAPEANILPTVELTGALDDPMQELQSQEQADYGSGDMALETPEPSVELPVPGVRLIQQLPALRVAMTDITFDIAKETALNWDIAFGDAGSSADAGKKPKTKPKVRLQLLCFANHTLKDADLSSEEFNLHTLQQSWPQPGSLIVQLNVDTPYQRVWLGHDIPEPTGESGRGICLEKYVRAGVNKLRLLQLRDIGEFTLVLVAKPAPLEESDPIDAALAQLQQDLIESMEEWKESLEGGIRPLVGRVEVERLGEDEDD